MEKCVCYCITRNLYSAIVPSLESMIRNGKPDGLFIVAEDNSIGIRLPDWAQVINMRSQGYFRIDGPNYAKKWTYMAMMKTAMARIFDFRSRIMTLDHDTLILGDLSELWEMPMDDNYVAGCNEPYWERIIGRKYINAGVLMWNLDRIREDGIDGKMIRKLNTVDYRLPEQECINDVCSGKIMILDSAYNFCDYVDPPEQPVKILHFAGKAGRESWMRREIWRADK